MDDQTVTIETKEYETLMQAVRVLESFLRHGVDNWEGYEASMKDVLQVV